MPLLHGIWRGLTLCELGQMIVARMMITDSTQGVVVSSQPKLRARKSSCVWRVCDVWGWGVGGVLVGLLKSTR